MQERRHIKELTGLRGIGALWVVLFHLTFGHDIAIVKLGFLGVDLFFILSGFVLSQVSKEIIVTPSQYLEFLRQRLTRIYPLHLFVLCALALIVLTVPGFEDRYDVPRFEPDAFVASLLLIQNWFYWLPACWNGPSWSLSAEWFAHLTFPICQWLTARWRGIRVPIALVLTAFLSLYAILTQRGISFDVVGSYGMIRMAAEFGAGALLFRAWHNGLVCPPTPSALCGIVLLAIGLMVPGFVFFVLPAFSIFILLSAQDDGWMAGGLSLPVIVWLGNISYSLYLTHWPIMQLSNWWLDGTSLSPASQLAWNVMLLAGLLAFAQATYRWIEIPARTWTRRVTQRNQTATDLRAGRI